MYSKKILYVILVLVLIASVSAQEIWTTDGLGNPKLDYAPWETVYIQGKDFSPNSEIYVSVTWPDGKFDEGLDFSDNFGSFVYEYQLVDGIFGNYYVYASDGTYSAETIFTDGPMKLSYPAGGDSVSGVINIQWYWSENPTGPFDYNVYYLEGGPCGGGDITDWTLIGTQSCGTVNCTMPWDTTVLSDGSFCVGVEKTSGTYKQDRTASTFTVYNAVCGDGIIEEEEECDGDSPEQQQCGSTDVGECEYGSQTRSCVECAWSEWSACEGYVDPVTEVCDGLDNDCDGSVDEGLGTTPTSCGVGVCADIGVLACVDGSWQDSCIAGTPSGEICDNLDNDCDGSVDEDLTRSCGNACFSGSETCSVGEWGSCDAQLPPTNYGQECTDGVGECLASGTIQCDGSCSAIPGTPTGEICDNLDNDCDGQIDEDLTRSCNNQCFEGQEVCSAGSWGVCDAQPEPGNLGSSCSAGVGECLASGTIQCDGSCSAIPGEPSEEICDGLDNDCDSVIDEDDVCVECGNGIIDKDEECDDGNQNDTDSCSNSCLLNYCGDGIINNGEECDDGGNEDEDGCSSECLIEICDPERGIIRPSSGITKPDNNPQTFEDKSGSYNPGENGGGIGFSLDISPENSCPEIDQETVDFFVHTWTDEIPDSFGPVPANLGWEDLLDIAYKKKWVGRSYAFDGELITFTFEAQDRDGIVDDCIQGYVTLDNGVDPRVVQCSKEIIEKGWCQDGQHAKFTCEYIVEDAETRQDEYWISVEVADSCGEGCSDVAPGEVLLFLNPAVGLTMKSRSERNFEFAYDVSGDVLARVQNGYLVEGPKAGDTVYTPWFIIENSADRESGLYILLKMYGTDFRSEEDVIALCPDQNRLSITQMEYRASHLNAHQTWTTMPDGTNYGPLDADYIFTNWDINSPHFNGAANILGVGDDISMRLRLLIPNPCIGEFTQGGDVIFIGRVV